MTDIVAWIQFAFRLGLGWVVSLFMGASVMAQMPPSRVPLPPAFEPAATPNATRATGLENKTVATRPLSSTALGTLTPESGKWNTFVTVSGPNFATAERVAVIWYPNDDASQPQAGRITATMRSRSGANQIQIEMPRDAGGAQGGVVRVYLYMPGQLQPQLAGRFTVQLVSANTAPFVPQTLETAAFRMTGVRLPDFQPMTIETAPFRMAGMRLPNFVPLTLETAAFRMSGVRLPGFVPLTIETAPFHMTGQRLKQIPAGGKLPLTDLQPAR